MPHPLLSHSCIDRDASKILVPINLYRTRTGWKKWMHELFAACHCLQAVQSADLFIHFNLPTLYLNTA